MILPRSFLRTAAATELVAVIPRADRVDVAQVSRNGAAPPVVKVCVSMASSGAVEDALVRLRKDLHLHRRACATVLNPGEYQLQALDAPEVPDQELKSAVRWRLKDFLGYPVESATVDVVRIPADPNAPTKVRSVYAVSARNEHIAARMKQFAQAHIPLAVIDIPEMAQRNLAALLETERRALALLSFNEDRGLLTFTSGGELYLARSIEVGLSQLTVAGDEARQAVFERIVLELQRSLDHFDRQFSHLSLARLVLSPLPEDCGLQPYLSANLYVPVEAMNLGEVLDFGLVPALRERTEQVRHFLALGAALRSGAA